MLDFKNQPTLEEFLAESAEAAAEGQAAIDARLAEMQRRSDAGNAVWLSNVKQGEALLAELEKRFAARRERQAA